jgi:hypothetical protein
MGIFACDYFSLIAFIKQHYRIDPELLLLGVYQRHLVLYCGCTTNGSTP